MREITKGRVLFSVLWMCCIAIAIAISRLI